MIADNWWLLSLAGVFSGLLAGLLGIGGGTVLVPILVALNYTAVQAVATSSLAIIMTSIGGSIQNWRMGYLDLRRVILLGIPSLITAQIGAILANIIPDYILLASFAIFLIINIFLANLRTQLSKRQNNERTTEKINPVIARIATGGAAGLLAGLFGIGGGVIMVPLQMILLGEPIKVAIQTSLGVIVITAISSTLGHALQGNVLFLEGIILGIGGVIGSQISTRKLPKLPDKTVSYFFYGLLGALSIYLFWQAWNSYQVR